MHVEDFSKLQLCENTEKSQRGLKMKLLKLFLTF